MSNDMGEIEAALDEFQDASERVYEAMPDPAFGDLVQRQKDARKALVALIHKVAEKSATSAQPAGDVAQNVQAWADELTRVSIHCGGAMQVVQRLRDEGVRLMQRPSDAEHEAKVEAWHKSIAACRLDGLRTEQGWSVYGIPYVLLEDAKSLMRARPAATDTAAPEAKG